MNTTKLNHKIILRKIRKNVVQNKSNLILKNYKEIIYNYNFVIGRGHLDNLAFRIFGMENLHIKWHSVFLKVLAEILLSFPTILNAIWLLQKAI
jgi:hypothetical protein